MKYIVHGMDVTQLVEDIAASRSEGDRLWGLRQSTRGTPDYDATLQLYTAHAEKTAALIKQFNSIRYGWDR